MPVKQEAQLLLRQPIILFEIYGDDGYSRRGNFGGSLVHNMAEIYLSNGTNVCGSKTAEFGASG